MRGLVTLMDEGYSHKMPFWLITATVVGFFLWASVAQVDQQVHGNGRVIPSGKIRSIQHLEGGIINEIHIKEGDTVNLGDILFVITNKRAEADLSTTQADVDADIARKTRLQAEYAGQQTLTFDPALEKKYPEIAATEQKIFLSRNQEFKEKLDGLQQRYQQKILKLGELGTTIQNLSREAAVARQQLEIKNKLRISGAISQSQYLDTDSQVKNFNTQIAKTQDEIPITKAELAEIQNNIEEAKKTHQAQIAQDLNTVNLDLHKQQDHIAASQDQVNRAVITSPVRGIVNKLYFNTIGGVIKPGEVMADIIPLDESLIVDAHISTKDRGKVWLGLPAVAKITAYNYSLYGGIKGKLSYISPDSFTDNRNNEYYRAEVTLDSNIVSKDKPIYPGMTVDLNILAGKISVLQAILMPLREIKDNALSEIR